MLFQKDEVGPLVVFFVAFAVPETYRYSLLREGEERQESTVGATGA